MKKRNRQLLILLLLLLAAVGIYWFTQREQKIKAIPSNFIVQDSALHISGDNLIIKVWDYNAVDGDTVNVLFDGKIIFETLGLEGTPVVYNAKKLVKGEHWIGVEGINEGSTPPATTHVSVDNGHQVFEFDIEAYINKPAVRKIFIN